MLRDTEKRSSGFPTLDTTLELFRAHLSNSSPGEPPELVLAGDEKSACLAGSISAAAPQRARAPEGTEPRS